MAALSLLFAVSFGAASDAQTFKVAQYNVQSGKGIDQFAGHPDSFDRTDNCNRPGDDPTQPLNAWGTGFFQTHALGPIKNDPAVVALAVQEAWNCATPERIRSELGWADKTAEFNGTAIIARYGFKNATVMASLTTSNNDPKHVVYRQICLKSPTEDPGCTQTLDVFSTHWAGGNTNGDVNAQESIAFMGQQAGSRPHVLLGDLNVWEDGRDESEGCGLPLKPAGLDRLRTNGYLDAWRTLHPDPVTDPGYTFAINRAQCVGGDLFRRLDYAWSMGLTPLAVDFIGKPAVVGDEGPSDHIGIVVTYSLDPPSSDTVAPTVSITSPNGGTVSGSVTVAMNAQDESSGVARVELLRDSAVVGSTTTSPYTITWDTTADANGSHTLQAAAYDGANNRGESAPVVVTVDNTVPPPPGGSQQDVVWTNIVNAIPSGNSIEKNAGCSTCGDAGAMSQQQIAGGTGWVQFTPAVPAGTNLAVYAGLGSGLSTPAAGSQYGYAFSFWQNGGWDIRELGVYKAEGTFAAGDVFKIAIEAGPVVTYYKNDAVVYTSTAPPPTYPYTFGTTLWPIGAGVSNATIATTAVGGSGVPTAYQAITDTQPRAKPPVNTWGPAGSTFADPVFSSTILRVTDASTRPGFPNRSYRMPSNSHLAAWNATSTMFFVISSDGTALPYSFDPATMTASRLQPSTTGNGGLTLAFYVEPQFSLSNPNVIYGVASGGNTRTIKQYDFSTDAYTTVLDLDTVVSGLTGYVGGIITGGTAPETMLTFFGGSAQDQHFYALWFPVANPSARKMVNTLASTINGVPTNISLDFRLHAIEIDKSGRFVFLFPTGADRGAPRYASPVYLWDTASDTITALKSGGNDGGPSVHPNGHDAAGYGVWVNQDCCTSTTWDAAQWQFRSLTAPTVTKDLINPVLQPQQIYLADHQSWNNAQPGTLVPFISSTYRSWNNTAAWRAWDDEIIAVQSDVAPGSTATVWRFAHHRSNIVDDHNASAGYFWYQPIANVSPDGRWVLFTSNWEKTLGSDPTDTQHRQDVFLVKLVPAAVTGGGDPSGSQNVVWSNTVNATATGNSLQKTSGCGTCGDAGGVSEQQIASATGAVELSPAVPAGSSLALYAGLGANPATPPAAASIDYAFSFWGTGGWDIRELGVYKTEGTFVAGDVFKIAVEAGSVVRYYKNGTLVYTSTTNPANYPYRMATTLFATGAAVNGAVITTP